MSTDSERALREHIAAAIADHDRRGAVAAALDAVRTGDITIERLYTQVLTPYLVSVGVEWQRGRRAVWEEHIASATVRTIVESLFLDVAEQASRSPRLGRTILLACPPGEQHELGLRMLTDRLAIAGWTAHFLGADTPVEEIIAAAKALHADVVALSAATHFNRVLLRREVETMAAALPGVKVGVGGPAFAHDRNWPAGFFLTDADLGLPDDLTRSEG
jgi:methanogenic corrinoid protein MtbC1